VSIVVVSESSAERRFRAAVGAPEAVGEVVRLVISALREVSKVVRAVWKVVFILESCAEVEGEFGWR
jgi:hypothetical protein